MEEFLNTLMTMLGIGEVSSEINRSTSDYGALAASIIRAAQARGQEALTKAMQAINAIPQLAGSAAVRSAIRSARAEAYKRYSNIEKRVNEMNDAAESTAQSIQSRGSGSAIGRWIRGDKRKAKKEADKALKLINNVDLVNGTDAEVSRDVERIKNTRERNFLQENLNKKGNNVTKSLLGDGIYEEKLV